MKNKMKICSGLIALLAVMPNYAAASSTTTDSDTGTEILDYIEFKRKAARENAQDPELRQLHKEAVAQAKAKPADPTKPAPITFEGDDITYDERNGAVLAKGNVRITQIESRLLADEIKGNAKTADVYIDGKAHMLNGNQPKLVLDGYKTAYNYQKKTGTMEKAAGKMDQEYVKGEKLEFYPERVVIYDGTMTKCSAKNPDYHVSAEKIEIWPNERMVLHNAKFWIKGTVIATRKTYETRLDKKDKKSAFPRIGYNDDDGVYVRQAYEYPLLDKVNAEVEINYYSKHDFKNVYSLNWYNRYSSYNLEYGSFEDSDDNWIKKEPTFKYQYGTRRIGTSPFKYYLGAEIGKWTDSNKTSWHKKYYAGLTRDAISFGKKLHLYTGTAYSITRESYDDSKVNSWSYDATFVNEFDSRWTAYTGYHYTQNTTANSLFNYDSEDYGKKWESGISYRFDDHNRIVIGQNYDVDASKVQDVDYYWYHDMHCVQMVLRYREKRDKWQVHFEFAPW